MTQTNDLILFFVFFLVRHTVLKFSSGVLQQFNNALQLPLSSHTDLKCFAKMKNPEWLYATRSRLRLTVLYFSLLVERAENLHITVSHMLFVFSVCCVIICRKDRLLLFHSMTLGLLRNGKAISQRSSGVNYFNAAEIKQNLKSQPQGKMVVFENKS